MYGLIFRNGNLFKEYCENCNREYTRDFVTDYVSTIYSNNSVFAALKTDGSAFFSSGCDLCFIHESKCNSSIGKH